MDWGNAIVDVGGSILGGLIGSKSAGKANKAYQKAMEDIIRQAGVTTGQQGALFQPYGEFGQESLNRLRAFEEGAARGDYSAITQMPEYQFAKQQGESDIARKYAAQGGLFGGQAQKQFMDYNQALASTQMQNYLNRLQGGVQTGMAGAAGQAQPLGNFLNIYGQARGIQGQSAAGKAASQGNIWQSVLGDIGKSVIKGMS
jgi:hypothetical protein